MIILHFFQSVRIILCANSTSKVIPAIQSRCLLVRIPAPTHEEIVNILQSIGKKPTLKKKD